MSNKTTIKSIGEKTMNGKWEIRMMTLEGLDGEYKHLRLSDSNYPFNLEVGMECTYDTIVDDNDDQRIKGLKPVNMSGGSSNGYSGGGRSSKGGGGNYAEKNKLDRERFEFDKDVRQKMIVNQSSLSTTVEFLKIKYPEGNKDITPEKVMELAARFTKWNMENNLSQ